ncbi:hypothetical protein DFH09DRAFT_1342411 [Mycena vulgaris]|nr:hypothetical protein DFH09DRAFT_1342411 [Mycena vulgaris]
MYIFKCKHASQDHPGLTHAQSKTSTGTTNLKNTADQCNSDRDVLSVAEEPSTAIPSHPDAAPRTRIAMHCATSHRPFDLVKDRWYNTTAELLRTGTNVPDLTTVSRDAKNLTSIHQIELRVISWSVSSVIDFWHY